MKKQRIQIDEPEDLICIMEEMVDEFLEGLFDKGGYTRDPEEGDGGDAMEHSFVWKNNAQELYDRYMSRLQNIFHKYYPSERFHLCLNWYHEF